MWNPILKNAKTTMILLKYTIFELYLNFKKRNNSAQDRGEIQLRGPDGLPLHRPHRESESTFILSESVIIFIFAVRITVEITKCYVWKLRKVWITERTKITKKINFPLRKSLDAVTSAPFRRTNRKIVCNMSDRVLWTRKDTNERQV